jgi:hypothetical protein
MKKRLLKKTAEKKSNTTSKHNPSIAKKTYQSKTTELVPIFAARWRAMWKHFINSNNKQPKRMMPKQPHYKENTTRLYPTNRPQNKFKKNQSIIIKISSYLNKTA